jgi:hypothetical protein
MNIEIESTPNGVWITVGIERRLLPTTDVAVLQTALRHAQERCGKWTVVLHPFSCVTASNEKSTHDCLTPPTPPNEL